MPTVKLRSGNRRGPRPAASPAGREAHAQSLPGPVTTLLGRAEQLSEVAGLIESSRLVTLSGPAGIGKTRLVLELAGELSGTYPDGVALVELARIAEPGSVPRALAGALSIQEVAGKSFTDALVAHLREHATLIVLDGCEHFLDAAAELVEALLPGCPDLSILATSREPLALAGETVWQVPPLPVPTCGAEASPEALARYAAVELFVECARAAQPGFALNAYVAPAVAEICRRLDGVPLAIDLAARQLESLTPAEIARRLDDSFALLIRDGPRHLGRHHALEAALDWSHELLSGPERTLLRRLSVFVGGFELEAAAAVCAGGGVERVQVRELIDRLTFKSLLVADLDSFSQARYRLVETVRAHAGERLEEAGETGALREAHARFYLALAERAEPELAGPGQGRWLARLDSERANVRLATEWSLGQGRTEWALRLAGALALYWRLRCRFSGGRELLEAVVTAADGEAPALRAKVLWAAGLLTASAGDVERALGPLQESLSLFRELGDPGGSARALMTLANCRQFHRDPSVPSLLEESAELARAAGDSWCLANARRLAGRDHSSRNELSAARPLLEDSVAVARGAQDRQSLRLGLLGLGSVALAQGDYAVAESVLEEAMVIARELDEDYARAIALQHLGRLALGRGERGRARELLEEAMDVMPEAAPANASLGTLVALARVARAEGDRRGARRLLEEAGARAGASTCLPALLGLGELAADEEDAEEARRLFEQAREEARARGDRWAAAQALHGMGSLARIEGEPERAAAAHHEALSLRREIGEVPGIAASFEAISGLAAHTGAHQHAARLLGAAQALRDSGGYARDPSECSRHEADLALVREALRTKELEAALAQGAGLSIEEAAVLAAKGDGRRRPATGWPSLTDREREVAELVAEGLTNAEIGERLFLSADTVKTHLSNAFSKLGLANRRELAREVRYRREQPLDQ